MKKLLFTLIVMFLPMMASADSSGQCGDMVMYNYNDSTHTLIISGEGSMYNTEAPWESYKKEIETVIINEGVISISDYAFYGCGLTTITIPNSVTSIGMYAFEGCSGLTSVEIPDSVTSIGEGAFISCSGLTSVTIPNGLTSISEGTFINCTGLSSITIPKSITSIGNYAFYKCSSLQDFFCNNKAVPSTDSLVFDGSNIINATLHVPQSALNDYKITSPWSEFGKFETLPDDDPDQTGIHTPQTGESEYPVNIYTIDGRRISKPQRGINILRMGDGRSKKVIIRR